MAFVALDGSGALLGVVRMVADPDYTRGEYAVLVRSDLKGMWPRLAAHAAPDRLRQGRGAAASCTAPCWRTTPPCCSMCRELGFAIAPEPGDHGVKRVRLQLV